MTTERRPLRTAGVVFMAHVILYLVSLRQRLEWDGISFLAQSHDALHPDFAHLLYPATIAAFRQLTSGFVPDAVISAQLLSALCAAAAAVVLWRVYLSFMVPPGIALVATALATTGASFWIEATNVEVYAPAMLGVLLATWWARVARTRAAAGVAAAAALLVAGAFHVAMLLAAVWVLAAIGRGGRSSARGWTVVGGMLVAGGLLAWALAPGEQLVAFGRYVVAFLPRPENAEDGLAILGKHLHELGRFFGENEPVLAASGGLGLVALLWRDRRELGVTFAWALPGVLLYVVLGVPLLGLLLPVLPVLALWAARGAAVVGPRAGAVLLGVAVVVQLALVVPDRWHEATTPDPRQLGAQRIATALASDAVVVAGELSMHLRHHTGLRVISLSEVARRRLADSGGVFDAPAMLRDQLAPHAAAGRPMWITADAALRLFRFARPAYDTELETVGALAGFFAAPDAPVVASTDPPLVLNRLRLPPARSEADR